jgi:GNAT superfamily N-acetyltransferase
MKVAPKLDDFKEVTLGNAACTQWHLQRIGILPEWQGKGVGTALIEEVRQKVNILLLDVHTLTTSKSDRLTGWALR